MTQGTALVVGASHAGAQVVAGLRQQGWSGRVVLIGDEAVLPYHRPPLSKAYLSGKSGLAELAIRKPHFYAKQEIELLDARVESIERAERRLVMADGDSLSYDKLALCTGGRARLLPVPGADLPGVHYLRTFADVEQIRESAQPGRHAVIVGGGYIGLETAASLLALGLDVTVLEAAERVLMRVTAPEVSAFYERIHREAGVTIRTGALVEAMTGEARVREVQLAGGERLPADLVVIGVGIEPNTELAAAAGLLVDDGVVIDDHARTNDPDIVAAGDCTSHWMTRYGRRIRLESVPNASEQAKAAAATMCGKEKTITALPWFWSDQYDLKLQIAGLSTGYDEILLSGDPTQDRDFTCFYLREQKLIAADCVNRPRDFMRSKQKIAQGLEADRAELLQIAAD
ncbi:NAD(P)/FAD-dependent oxidoreductase [Nocardioides kribbensis]|jgi:3-phenylpropionate/trans-cinnamate dioxygenase ferredoxin reductase subunit|uniref:FAD-dependent oxidoreductase n=1 Tax=Nocardioides kribbensis TaxID=305517 RepID=A0ABV1P3P1_9ACTN